MKLTAGQQPWPEDDMDDFIGLFVLLHFCHANVCPQHDRPQWWPRGTPFGNFFAAM